MKRKLSILSLLFLIVIHFASSSNYTVSFVTNTQSTLGVGNNKYMDLIISPTVTDVKTYTFLKNVNDSNNLQPYPVVYLLQRDILVLSPDNPNSIIFGDTVVSPGGEISFNDVGNKTFTEVINPNVTGSVIVSQIPYPIINITFMGLNFNYTFSFQNQTTPTTFELNGEKQLVMNITVPKNAPATKQEFVMTIDSGRKKESKILNFEITKIMIWDVSSVELIKEVDSGTNGIAGNITFTNDGNSASTVNLTFTGDISNILSLPTTTTLYPNTNTKLTMFYNLGQTIKTGTYSGNLVIKGLNNDLSKTINMSIIVKDRIVPEIEETSIPTFVAGFRRTMRFKIKDNTGIKNVVVSPVNNLNLKEDKVGLAKDAQTNWWTGDFSPQNVGSYKLNLEISDIDNNTLVKTYDAVSVPQDVVSYKTFYKFFTTKYDRWSIIEFLEINETTPITVTLSSLTYAGNKSIALTFPNQEQRFFDTKLPQPSIVISQPGKYQLSFKGDAIGDFNGIIKLTALPLHKSFNDITITGEIKDFYVPPPYNAAWYGGVVNCEVEDGGNPETSKTICTVSYDGYVDIKDSALPVTGELKNKQESEFQATVNEWKTKDFKKALVIGFLIFLLIVLIVYLWWMAVVYPVLYIRWR